MKKNLHRRDVLKFMAYASMVGASSSLLPKSLLAATTPAYASNFMGKTLIIIKLDGGNDGLNTVISQDPTDLAIYNKYRPTIAIPASQQIHANSQFNFNPALKPLADGTPNTAWGAGDMAVALGVGYPDLSLQGSHFTGSDIWGSAVANVDRPSEGWISRLFTELSNPLAGSPALTVADAIQFGAFPAQAIGGLNIRAITVASRQNFTADAEDTNSKQLDLANPTFNWLYQDQQLIDGAAAQINQMAKLPLKNSYGSSDIGYHLACASKLIVAAHGSKVSGIAPVPGLNIPVISLSMGTFDTHIAQNLKQPVLLNELMSSLAAFRAEMIYQGLWDKVLVMTHAEFGRSVIENSAAGTDHGRANCHFLLGGNVAGGKFIGTQKPLNTVDVGNVSGLLRSPDYTQDFRSLYTSIITGFWGLPQSVANAVLTDPYTGQTFNPLVSSILKG